MAGQAVMLHMAPKFDDLHNIVKVIAPSAQPNVVLHRPAHVSNHLHPLQATLHDAGPVP